MKTTYDDFRVHRDSGAEREVSCARGKGVVASATKQSSEIGVSVLRAGGNAFDAAFALAFALAIYHPQAGSIGGGGYLIYKKAGSRVPRAINYREASPLRAVKECYTLPDGSPDPEKTAFGPASACVPGMVKAFFSLQREHGLLKTADILNMLADRAEEGGEITQYEADCLNRLSPKLSLCPESKKIYVKENGQFKKGDRLPNKDLAATLRTLAREGEKAFYEGSVAEQIEQDMAANGGFMTVKDLAGYEIREVKPLSIEFRDKTVWSVPPEGGGPILVEILNILSNEAFFLMEPLQPDFLHYFAQACKMSFIDRLYYHGDINLQGNEVYESINNRAYGSRLFQKIERKMDRITESVRSFMHPSATPASETSGALSSKETTHFCVVDSSGNAVTSSYTLNLRYGSKWSVAGAGFLLNGSMDAFAFTEGASNYFGVLGCGPNLFKPGKRPASSMAPTIVTAGDELEMVLGTPGGPTIPTAIALALLLRLVHGMEPERIIRYGRFHHQGWPDVFYFERGLLEGKILEDLIKRGYRIQERSEPIGDMQAIFRERDQYLAVSDYRREGCALSQ